jgi:glucose/arabinose dehydrogenase
MMTPTRRSSALAAAVGLSLASLGLAACGDGESTSGTPTSDTQVGTGGSADGSTTVASGDTDPGSGSEPATTAASEPSVDATIAAELDEPIDLRVRPGDDHLWVAERAGTIRRLTVSDEGRSLEPDGDAVLDLSDETTTDAERGLLGIAFSEAGDTLFASYTNLDGDTRVVSYAVDGNVVDQASRTVLLALDQPYSNHNGGHLELGPDGKLWFGLGDGGSANDPQNRAQDPDLFFGKMLRLDPTGGDDPEIMVSGLRNPWRFSFDDDDNLWIGDVGQNQWEEINRLPADQIEGTNLGWSALEGTHQNTAVDPEGRTGEDPVPPVFEYSHDGGNCSVTAGSVYQGQAIPSLQGAYLFADYCAGRVRAIRLDGDGELLAEYDLDIEVSTPVSFGTDAAGEAYVLSGDGDIVRLVPGG